MKYQYPYLVDKIHKKLPTVYVNLMSSKCSGKTFKELGITEGYVGNPAKANEEYGKLHFQEMANVYADAALALYEKKKLLEMPRNLKLFMKLPFY
jgi:creatinine amidohydrolase